MTMEVGVQTLPASDGGGLALDLVAAECDQLMARALAMAGKGFEEETMYSCIEEVIEKAAQFWEEVGMIKRLDGEGLEGGMKWLGGPGG